jgi:hypothetical protein
MKKTKKPSLKALSLIFVILSTGPYLSGQSLLGGTLQFAKNTLDSVHVYHCGKTITTQNHQTTLPKITYEIPKGNEQTTFYLLICPTAPNYSLKQFPDQDVQQNTIDYLKIDPTTPYLFYRLELVYDEVSQMYHWEITEETLSNSGQIPDMAIIINYFPGFIKDIKGGNQLELPTLYIDNSAIGLFESQESFEDALLRLQLSSLDLNALHAPAKRKIKNTDNRRLLIMDTIA